MVRAIDVHIHPPAPGYAVPTDAPETKEYFGSTMGYATPEEMAAYYAALDIVGVLFHSDAETATGTPPVPNDFIASIVEKYPKQFIGFGSVDPWKGKAAVLEVERCTKLGLQGLKFHPQQQAFFPNDQRFYPLWEAAQSLGLVALFHTGTTGVGAGLPGGGGVKLKYARPIPYIDDVAADFPEMTIVMAHPSFPWQDEQLAMLVHKPNVYMDLSGWSPKYFSPLLVQYARTIAQDKVMFGSDYPVITPERWLKDFDTLGLDDAVRRKVLIDNAKRVLKLDQVVNDADLIAASDTNYFESWRSMAELSGLVYEDGGILITAPSRVLPWLNVVFVTRPLADPVAELGRAFARLDERKLPFLVHMREGMDEASERACEQLGLVSEHPVPGMVLDPIVSRPNDSSLEIREVSDDATFADFIAVSAESFGIPHDDANFMFPPTARQRPNVRYWVGYADGAPAACSHVVVLDHIASINSIGTLEANRGRGFGAAVTQAAVNGGADAGCKIAVLQASELGQPVYQRMGFRTVTSYKTYLRPG